MLRTLLLSITLFLSVGCVLDSTEATPATQEQIGGSLELRIALPLRAGDSSKVSKIHVDVKSRSGGYNVGYDFLGNPKSDTQQVNIANFPIQEDMNLNVYVKDALGRKTFYAQDTIVNLSNSVKKVISFLGKVAAPGKVNLFHYSALSPNSVTLKWDSNSVGVDSFLLEVKPQANSSRIFTTDVPPVDTVYSYSKTKGVIVSYRTRRIFSDEVGTFVFSGELDSLVIDNLYANRNYSFNLVGYYRGVKGVETEWLSVLTTSNPPTIALLNPIVDMQPVGDSLILLWSDLNKSTSSEIKLFYSIFSNGDNKIQLNEKTILGSERTNKYTWITTKVDKAKAYYLFASIADSKNTYWYSHPNRIYIKEPGDTLGPVLTLSENGQSILPNQILLRESFLKLNIDLNEAAKVQYRMVTESEDLSKFAPVDSIKGMTITSSARMQFISEDLNGNKGDTIEIQVLINPVGSAPSNLVYPTSGASIHTPTINALVSASTDLASLTINGVKAQAVDSLWLAHIPVVRNSKNMFVISWSMVDQKGLTSYGYSEVKAEVGAADFEAPELVIRGVEDGDTVKSASLSLSGTVYDKNGIRMVTVDGKVTTGREEWSSTIILKGGLNYITVKAWDESPNQNESTRIIRVFLEGAPSPVVFYPIVKVNDKLQLLWNMSRDVDFAKYEILSSSNKNMSGATLVTTITNRATTEYLVPLTSVPVYFQIRVVDEKGIATSGMVRAFIQ